MDESFYVKHQKVYPREVHGVFATLRTSGVFILLGLYYITPWLNWEGRQAVLLDLPQRQFHLFAVTFWPQDFFYFATLLIIAGIALFFFTALAGRLWCGYACPQTVWTEVFLWIERKVEGTRNQQIKRDKQSLNRDKVFKKITKHTVWIIFSLFTGITFVGYFTPIETLGSKLLNLETGPWESFWIVFYSLATYGNAGWLREQVCIYMCPYARFQSAMFDRDTLIISYDQERGEPRGSRKKGITPKSLGLGDCIDCNLCVQVCPTGIDIRKGLQYQCIGCAACIDVCHEVMQKMSYPAGLIRYTTENEMDGQKTRILRPRIAMYGALLLAISFFLFISIANRTPLELDIIRDRNTLYRELSNGMIENNYNIRIVNMSNSAQQYQLSVSGLTSLQLVSRQKIIKVSANEVYNMSVQLRIQQDMLEKSHNMIYFHLRSLSADPLSVTEKARFIGPAK